MKPEERRGLLNEIFDDLDKEIKDLESKAGPMEEAYQTVQRDLNRLKLYRDKLTSVLAVIAKYEGPVSEELPKPDVIDF